MAKPGILMITPWLAGGGIERNVEIVAPWFAQRGYRVEVLSWIIWESISGVPNPVLETLNRAGVPIRRLWAYGRLQLIQRAAQVAALALRERFGLIVGYELEGNIVAIMAKLLLVGRVRAFAQIHNASNAYEAFQITRLKHRLAEVLYRRSNGIIAISEAIRKDAIAFFKVDPALITTIPAPIAIDRIQFQAAMAADPSLERLKPFVLACGRLVKMKAFTDLIQAFCLIANERSPKLNLVILGTGPEREVLDECAARCGLSDRVYFPGFRENPFPYFAHAAAFVLSSRFGEAMPAVLIQAMACGLPVISSRCQWGPEELLEDERYGLLYDVGDVRGLAAALTEVFDRPQEAAGRAEKALLRAREFAPDSVLPRLERYYSA